MYIHTYYVCVYIGTLNPVCIDRQTDRERERERERESERES
jgi:hypothetical protein